LWTVRGLSHGVSVLQQVRIIFFNLCNQFFVTITREIFFDLVAYQTHQIFGGHVVKDAVDVCFEKFLTIHDLELSVGGLSPLDLFNIGSLGAPGDLWWTVRHSVHYSGADGVCDGRTPGHTRAVGAVPFTKISSTTRCSRLIIWGP